MKMYVFLCTECQSKTLGTLVNNVDYRCSHNQSGIVKSVVIPNGVVCVDGLTLGSKAKYLCDDGYHLNGNVEMTCRIDGDWEGMSTKCEPSVIVGKRL